MSQGVSLFVLAVILSVPPWTCTVQANTRFCAVGDFGADVLGDLGLSQESTAAAIVRRLDGQDRLDGILALGDTNYPGKAKPVSLDSR
jgi:hypothetical protein